MDIINITNEEVAGMMNTATQGKTVEELQNWVKKLKADKAPEMTILMEKALLGTVLKASDYQKLQDTRRQFIGSHSWHEEVTVIVDENDQPTGETTVTYEMNDSLTKRLWFADLSEHVALAKCQLVTEEDRKAIIEALDGNAKDFVQLEQKMLTKYRVPRTLSLMRGLKGKSEVSMAHARLEKAKAEKNFRDMKVSYISARINEMLSTRSMSELKKLGQEFFGDEAEELLS